ncbi:MAG TPA: type I-E CRISPR-associated protein Cas5/CasD [Longimicrobiales bacterium]
MGKPVLLIRLEGPLQAWGTRARWDVRDTAREPTRSGVIGLLAAALGYDRNDPRIVDELEAGLEIGVRVEREGDILDDYHTITGYLPTAEGSYRHSGIKTASNLAALIGKGAEPSTIQSTRRYLVDASFLVALACRADADESLLMRCADALRAPHWPLYLGRRSCIPSRPVFETLTTRYDGVEHALRRYPWSCFGFAAESRGRPAGKLRIVLEGGTRLPRDDRPAHGAARLFARRFVEEHYVDANALEEGT